MLAMRTRLAMRTLLVGLLVAAIVSACGTVTPSPSSAAVRPTATIRPSAQPSATQSGYTIDCGPLASAPDDCEAAVAEALRSMLPRTRPGDFSELRVEPPGPTCTWPCYYQPTVFVRAFKDAGSILVAQVGLVRAGSGWRAVSTPAVAAP